MGKGRERSGKRPQHSTLTVEIDGITYVIDPRTLTLAERQRMKRELAKLGYEPDDTDVLSATIWVVARRQDPELSFEDICEAITVEHLEKMDAQFDEPGEDPSPEA